MPTLSFFESTTELLRSLPATRFPMSTGRGVHVTLWHFARSTTFGRFTSPARPPQTCPRAPATQRAGGWWAPVAEWHPGSMRASHSAEGRLEARVVGVLILVQPLAEDGVHDALALLVDQPLHLETLEEERAALGENLLAILGGGSGGGHNHLAGLNGAAQPALAGVAELSHHEQARRQGGRSGAGRHRSWDRTKSPLASFSAAGR